MNKLILVVSVCIVLACASPLVKRQAGPTTYSLPDGAELLIGGIQHNFNCEGRIYGYYADVPNNCQIFHVCVPQVHADGRQETFMYSFFCGNQTVFDQAGLVCAHQQDALPCSQAESLYSINESFGRTDVPFRT